MALCLEPKYFCVSLCMMQLVLNMMPCCDAVVDGNKLGGTKRTIGIQLIPGKEFRIEGSGELKVFCQDDVPKSILYLWRDSHVRFIETPSDYKLYSGEDVDAVINQYNSEAVWHPATWVSWHGAKISLPAFGAYCVGIKAKPEAYSLQLVVRTVNYWKILQLCVGLFLFYKAEHLSRNTVFHYTSGISLGVMASVLVLMYILSKFIPKKPISYLVMVLSYSLVLYYIQLLYISIQSVIESYSTYLLAYIVFASITSFIVCYRFGPVSNHKTIHIIQWGIQVLSLLLIFFCTQYREVSTAIIMVMLSLYVIPSEWVTRGRVIWYRKFPPKIKLLTEEEYNEQGVKETQKALVELRQYCNSPECKAWSTIQKLKDPLRFAKFVEGSEHLSDAELLEYDISDDGVIPYLLTDDESETVVNNHVSHRL